MNLEEYFTLRRRLRSERGYITTLDADGLILKGYIKEANWLPKTDEFDFIDEFNGKLDFGDNIRSFGPVTAEFSNTLPTKINHGLGRTPIGYFVVGLDAAAIVFNPDRTSFPWTDTQIFLQSDTASISARILIF